MALVLASARTPDLFREQEDSFLRAVCCGLEQNRKRLATDPDLGTRIAAVHATLIDALRVSAVNPQWEPEMVMGLVRGSNQVLERKLPQGLELMARTCAAMGPEFPADALRALK